jgi:hypothetical protein
MPASNGASSNPKVGDQGKMRELLDRSSQVKPGDDTSVAHGANETAAKRTYRVIAIAPPWR